DYVSKPIRVNELMAALSRAAEAQVSGKAESGNPLDQAAIKTLLEVIGGEHELLVELIDSFLETAPPLLARLHQGVAQGNAAEVRAAALTIKSSSKDFGATRLAELCQTLEDMGKAGILAGTAELAIQVEAEYQPVKAALEAEREG